MHWVESSELKEQNKYCELCTEKENAATPCAECPRPKILPENIDAVVWYSRASTQWNISNGVLTGFRYEGISALFDMYNVSPNKKKTIIEALQLMEFETLTIRNMPVKKQSGEQDND